MKSSQSPIDATTPEQVAAMTEALTAIVAALGKLPQELRLRVLKSVMILEDRP